MMESKARELLMKALEIEEAVCNADTKVHELKQAVNEAGAEFENLKDTASKAWDEFFAYAADSPALMGLRNSGHMRSLRVNPTPDNLEQMSEDMAGVYGRH